MEKYGNNEKRKKYLKSVVGNKYKNQSWDGKDLMPISRSLFNFDINYQLRDKYLIAVFYAINTFNYGYENKKGLLYTQPISINMIRTRMGLSAYSRYKYRGGDSNSKIKECIQIMANKGIINIHIIMKSTDDDNDNLFIISYNNKREKTSYFLISPENHNALYSIKNEGDRITSMAILYAIGYSTIRESNNAKDSDKEFRNAVKGYICKKTLTNLGKEIGIKSRDTLSKYFMQMEKHKIIAFYKVKFFNKRGFQYHYVNYTDIGKLKAYLYNEIDKEYNKEYIIERFIED